MKTDDLIHQLSSDLIAVKPQMSPWRFASALSFFCFTIAGLGLFLVHLRPDWKIQFSEGPFLFDLFCSLGLLVSAMLLVGWLSSPGRGRGMKGRFAVVAFAALIGAFGLLRSASLSVTDMTIGLDVAGAKCFLTVLVFSLLPSLVIGAVTRKRAPLFPKTAGLALGLAAIGTGTLAITLHCVVDNGLHIALWHFLLPLLVGVLAGIIAGAKSLKW